MQASAGDLATLAPIAAQYGPFFFTLLFVLVVPLIGQQLIGRTISGAGDISREECEERLRSRRAYRTFGIAMSAFCLVFSLFWWAGAQIWPPPATQAAIDQKIQDGVRKWRIEGVIHDISDDDMFVPIDGDGYRLYVFPERDRFPMDARYVVLFDRQPTPNEPVLLRFGSQKTALGMRSLTPPGAMSLIDWRICYGDAARDLRIERPVDGPPVLSNSCS